MANEGSDNRNGYRGNNKGGKGVSGMMLPTMLKGIDKGYEIDGTISVPSQGNIIIGRSISKKDKTFSAVQSNPGFMLIQYLPIFGSDRRQETWAAITKQGENLWRTIRSATPHAENYQPGDVIANIVIAGGIRYGLAEARRRIESYMYQVVENNTFINDGIWRVLNDKPYDTDQLSTEQKKIVGWRNAYNGIVNRMSAVKFPDIFPIFHRWEYLSSTIFRDCEDESQAQYFAFTASHIYDWEIRSDPDDPGVDLVPKALPTDLDELLALLEEISVHVTSDSDMSDMFSDLVLAFPTAQCFKWDLLPKGQAVGDIKFTSVHSMDVKWALHNAQLVYVNAPTWHLTPEQGGIHGIISAPQYKAMGFMRPICATNNEKIDMTKFFNLLQWTAYDPEAEYDTHSQGAELINLPPELLRQYRVFWFGWDHDTGKRDLRMTGWRANERGFWSDASADLFMYEYNYSLIRDLNAISTFAFAPLWRTKYIQLPVGGSIDTTTPENLVKTTYLGSFTEIERPFIANGDQLVQMRNASRVGLWNIPMQLLNGKRNGNSGGKSAE